MNVRGKSINLFLMDGNARGRIKCTMANWTGIAYKIPRIQLEQCKDRNDLKQSGVYFLFGKSEETGDDIVYVGQAGTRKNGEGLLNRLEEHRRNPDKDYWNEAIVFTTTNDTFGPTEISYLENRFCNLALEAKRYKVQNCIDPTHGNVTEEKECELEEFIDYAKIIMGTLGHKVFEQISANIIPTTSQNEENSLLYGDGPSVKGIGKLTQEGFVVLKGSKIARQLAKSCSKNIFQYRKKYGNTIIDDTLTEDILFTSPSAAACFVKGCSVSGNIFWKTKDGIFLKDLDNTDNQ